MRRGLLWGSAVAVSLKSRPHNQVHLRRPSACASLTFLHARRSLPTFVPQSSFGMAFLHYVSEVGVWGLWQVSIDASQSASSASYSLKYSWFSSSVRSPHRPTISLPVYHTFRLWAPSAGRVLVSEGPLGGAGRGLPAHRLRGRCADDHPPATLSAGAAGSSRTQGTEDGGGECLRQRSLASCCCSTGSRDLQQ